MNSKKIGQLYFAPMEGITDPIYRETVMKLYPQWDYFFTDFLRLPTVGHLKTSRIISHIGENIFHDKELLDKTYFQILTTARVPNSSLLKVVSSLPIRKLDLNIGCPSKKVNAHGGGSFLLKDLEDLKKILGDIRENFDHHFSVKIRLGYENTDNFIKLLKLFKEMRVDQVIIHARTKKEMYKGNANWTFFEIASTNCSLPLIFNGDIKEIADIQLLQEKYPQAGLMCARGALITPWLAKQFYTNANLNQNDEVIYYFTALISNYRNHKQKDEFILKRLKSLSVYIIKNIDKKRSLLRSQSLKEFCKNLNTIIPINIS